MPGPLVTYVDVETALVRSLTPTEQQFIDEQCAQASALLRTAMPAVDARLAAADTDPTHLDPEAVAAMLAGIIARVLVNPTNATSVSNTTGPYSQTMGYGNRSGGASVGGLQITDADLAKLRIGSSFIAPATIRIASHPRLCR